MQKKIQQSIKKVRSELKRSTDKDKIFLLRDELKKLKALSKKEPLCF